MRRLDYLCVGMILFCGFVFEGIGWKTMLPCGFAAAAWVMARVL